MFKPGSQGQGLQGCSFSFLWAGTFLSKRRKRKKNTTCRDRCAQTLVRQSYSRKNVVEPVGETSVYSPRHRRSSDTAWRRSKQNRNGVGVILDENLTWEHHILHITKKVSQKIGALARATVPTDDQCKANILSLGYCFACTLNMLQCLLLFSLDRIQGKARPFVKA